MIINLLLIAIALSMDTFSLSLLVGTFPLSKKEIFVLSLIVGIFHFFMPLFGVLIGSNIIELLKIDAHFILGIVLIFIGIQILYELIKNEKESIKLSISGMFLFAFAVSFDSFSTGLGLLAITANIWIAFVMFSITSFIFTLSGLYLGKFANKYLGIYAQIIGLIILFSMGIYYIIC